MARESSWLTPFLSAPIIDRFIIERVLASMTSFPQPPPTPGGHGLLEGASKIIRRSQIFLDVLGTQGRLALLTPQTHTSVDLLVRPAVVLCREHCVGGVLGEHGWGHKRVEYACWNQEHRCFFYKRTLARHAAKVCCEPKVQNAALCKNVSFSRSEIGCVVPVTSSFMVNCDLELSTCFSAIS